MDSVTLLNDVEALMLAHAPPGGEGEVTDYVHNSFSKLNLDVTIDAAGNTVAAIPGGGSGDPVAVTAHKDEIAMMIRRVESDGRLRVRPLGGLHPWAIGETPVEILGARDTVPGVLSIGSKHVSSDSPAARVKSGKPLDWELMWIETKLSTEALSRAGVRVGTRVVLDRDRKKAKRIGEFVCGYNLDCRAGIAILLGTARALQETPPCRDVYLVVSSEEEVGAFGAIHAAGRLPVDEVIALDIAPVAEEYQMINNGSPVLLHADSQGLYHQPTLEKLHDRAEQLGFGSQAAVVTSYGSDASIAKKAGGAGRAVCLAYPGENTHGYEICSIEGIVNTARLLESYLTDPLEEK
ncbi:MAG: peptidase M42 [Gemmatimonadetes bacterium]|nr:peptidase M42 [Gemmatimonadota bacterium]